MSDEFAALVAAYRAENPGTALDARAVRARVLEATWLRRRRRLRRAVWLLPIAALLVGTGALAASAPAREVVARVLVALEEWAPARAVPARARGTGRHVAGASTLGEGALANTSSAATMPAVVPAPGVDATGERATVPAFGSAAPSQRPTSPAPKVVRRDDARSARTEPRTNEDSAERAAPSGHADASSAALTADLASYRAAHELHFADADYAHALEAWNAYLASFPRGTFAPEARLNRAVCLARLGRATEARSVLRALAESDDDYTRGRARTLRAALGDSVP
ncbi:MAG TPA: hypothetical protein VMI54_15410 [Polyangiaceae bacterium]|nr:hypothetical protein [Polyangiaceae bacterium]